ncbi:MAG: hypothetical protein CMI02_04895 [Oceanospirillaceae bacterium]|nr:hypothetical protein [Oceanospirillaceae bacterium]
MSVRIERQSQRALVLYLSNIGPKSIKAHVRTLNKTASKTKTEANQAIRGQVRLPAAYVKKNLKVRKASKNNLSAAVSTPSEGILLSRFSTDRLISGDKVSWIKPPPNPPRGIRVKVKPDSGTKVFDGHSEIKGKPFYMVLKKARRVAIAGRRVTPGPRGGKIKVFHGPSLSQVFTDVKDDLSEPMLQYQLEQFVKELEAIVRGY